MAQMAYPASSCRSASGKCRCLQSSSAVLAVERGGGVLPAVTETCRSHLVYTSRTADGSAAGRDRSSGLSLPSYRLPDEPDRGREFAARTDDEREAAGMAVAADYEKSAVVGAGVGDLADNQLHAG